MAEATLFLDLEGEALTSDEQLLLKEPLIGGVILFARNTQSAEQVKRLVQEIRAIRSDTIISIDQEGGRVQRLKEGVTLLPAVQSLKNLYKQNTQEGLNAAKELAYLMAGEMRALGIDISYAPVLDIDYGHNEVIGDRAFSDNVDEVIALSEAYISGMNDAGMAVTGKHFPGHGWVRNDTHHEGAVDTRSFDALWVTDLKPFRQGVASKIEAMMLAHVTYPECDELPAGYSNFWLDEILKKRLGYKGIIFSDDLCMKAAHSAGSYTDRAKAAIEAGCQALLCCNEREGTLAILEYMKSIGCLPLKSISNLKGREWVLDESRMNEARALAVRLLKN